MVQDFDLKLRHGEILGLIGPNGAGKSTVFNVIIGVCKPTAGRVMLGGEDITGLEPQAVARKGIGRVFQLGGLFQEYFVLQNVVAGFHLHSRAGLWRSLVNSPYSRREEQSFRQEAMKILKALGIEDIAGQLAASQSHGHQRVLALAVALATRPRVLLLDEPLTGMNPQEVVAHTERIRSLREQEGLTILLERR